MPLISIIVPVYNTEKYLRRCLDSLVNQTFNDIEIIIVNDCSQGNCKEIIEEYKKKDNRIKYIEHSENKGTLIARKTGSIEAEGDYITYVDSDDELDINTCKELHKIVSKEDYDFIRFGTKINSQYDVEGLILRLSPENDISVGKYPFIKLLETILNHNVCGGGVKKEIVKKSIPYIPDIRLNNAEDLLQCAITLYFCKTYKILNKKLYIYNYDVGVSPKVDDLEINKYKFLCETVKISLDEIYNFLCKLNIEKIYGYSFSKLCYHHYNYLNQVKDKDYKNILSDTFSKDFIEGYETFKEISDYNGIYYNFFKSLDGKLTPYFFSIIKYCKIKVLRLFGIQILLENKKYYKEPVFVAFNNLLNNIFSIKIDDKYFVLKILFIRIAFKKKI